jgi:CARDB
MRRLKSYSILIICYVFLVPSLLVACSQAPATTEKQTTNSKPAEFEVGAITYEPSVAMVGDTITVTTAIKNIGEQAGTYTAALSLDGQAMDSKTISLNPGDSQNINFALSNLNAGSHHLKIGSSDVALTVFNWSPYTIQYDKSDAVLVCIYVSGDNGHIVRFTPSNKAFKIQKIKILGTVSVLNIHDFDKNHVTVRIWDKESNNQLWSQDVPWRLFQGPAIWREIQVPNVRVNDDFQVEVVTHSNPAGYGTGGSITYGGNPIESMQLTTGALPGVIEANTPSNIVVIGFEYPRSHINTSMNPPETRSGYSYMGKFIDPGEGRFEGINWLIRVDGEGAPGS